MIIIVRKFILLIPFFFASFDKTLINLYQFQIHLLVKVEILINLSIINQMYHYQQELISLRIFMKLVVDSIVTVINTRQKEYSFEGTLVRILKMGIRVSFKRVIKMIRSMQKQLQEYYTIKKGRYQMIIKELLIVTQDQLMMVLIL